MVYRNLSHATKTFYGVTFKPGEEHDVPGYINNPKFIRVNEFIQKFVERAKASEQSVESHTVSAKKTGRSKTKEGVITDGTNSD